MNLKTSYHGWLIELIPEQKGYSFQCWILEENMAVSDRQIYPSSSRALLAAKQRADLESVSLALIRFLNEADKQCYLSLEEHAALLNSIVEFVNSTSKRRGY